MTKSQNCQFFHMAQRAMLHLDMKIQGVEYTYIENPTNKNNYNIGQLSREDFANSARIDLYSGNSASLFGFGKKTFATTDAMIKAVDIGRSFAEQLSLQSGARVTGVVGRTDYSRVSPKTQLQAYTLKRIIS